MQTFLLSLGYNEPIGRIASFDGTGLFGHIEPGGHTTFVEVPTLKIENYVFFTT